jgi:hypothetical protein
METGVDRSVGHGDRVTAARTFAARRVSALPRVAHGIVAEDRGSKLVVFFDEEDSAVNLTEPDLFGARR